MLNPELFEVHKKIIDNAFCIQNRKDHDAVSFIRLYDINGNRISGLIISDKLTDQYIDLTYDMCSYWQNWQV